MIGAYESFQIQGRLADGKIDEKAKAEAAQIAGAVGAAAYQTQQAAAGEGYDYLG